MTTEMKVALVAGLPSEVCKFINNRHFADEVVSIVLANGRTGAYPTYEIYYREAKSEFAP